MATVKTLVCLANSRKNAGRCVAGMVDKGSGRWIRPVSSRPNREVSEYERQYADRSDPKVLDIIAVPLLGPQASSYQSENWLLDPHYYWEKTGRAEWDKLLTLEQHPKTLWINGNNSYRGTNNRVSIEQARTLPDSLKLIRVDCVTLQVHDPGAAFGDSRLVVDAHFRHAGCEYTLGLTDPEYEQTYLAKPEGKYKLGESFLTVSLGEPYKDYAYKLVAAVIEQAKI
ncbi:dual OB domain-containing protein [Streptomyces sp. bgisy084]|uniref:dual OB domain-containing protein n=1 Tax=unclassified Streptomyces TaxID=2593676 RepID=UPI003D7557AC